MLLVSAPILQDYWRVAMMRLQGALPPSELQRYCVTRRTIRGHNRAYSVIHTDESTQGKRGRGPRGKR